MEILFIVLFVAIVLVIFKIATWILKTGIFLIALPFKIIGSIILGIGLILLITTIILPSILGILLSLLPIIIIALALALLLKYAT